MTRNFPLHLGDAMELLPLEIKSSSWPKLAPGPKKSAAARRWRTKNAFSKIPEKISFYPENFLITFFNNLKL